jgi:hypothetical protein
MKARNSESGAARKLSGASSHGLLQQSPIRSPDTPSATLLKSRPPPLRRAHPRRRRPPPMLCARPRPPAAGPGLLLAGPRPSAAGAGINQAEETRWMDPSTAAGQARQAR